MPDARVAYKYKPIKATEPDSVVLPRARHYHNSFHRITKNKPAITNRLERIRWIAEQVNQQLDATLRGHISVMCTEHNGRACVIAASSVWLNRARFAQTHILQVLNTVSMVHIDKIIYKIGTPAVL
jgi:hypothetical protein